MDIKSLDLTVKTLLETAFYKIPRFQRPYSWDQENINDFWHDAVASDDPDYFIGSFVLYKAKGNADLLYVVDGQQRLTSITLLLAATRDALHALGFPDLAAGVQKLIEREDINNDLTFVLDSETPYPYLQEHIQKYGEKEDHWPLKAEQEAIKTAYDFLCSLIATTLDAIALDPTLSGEKKLAVQKKRLLHIRDKLLRLQLISVQLGTKMMRTLIFETLNTRGKDLTVSDLVKNHLTRLLKPKHEGVDTARDKWNEILELFDKSESDIDVNRFLHHSWLSRKPYTTEKKLFKEIKQTVHHPTALGLLNWLVSDAYLYRQVLEPGSYKWNKEERAVADAIQALNIFRVVQPVPMMLSVVREYRNDGITLKQAKSVFRSMENFHVQFTAVTSQRTGGGTAFMYASSARQLLEAGTKDEKAAVLKEFIAKLRDRVPSYEEFDAAFSEIRFTNENTRQRQLVRYLLRRIDEHFRKGVAPDYSLMTIEHIEPQNPKNGGVQSNTVGTMGNLLFITGGQNDKLGNKPFAEKVALIREIGVPADDVIAREDEWNEETIERRTKWLAEQCYHRIFRV